LVDAAKYRVIETLPNGRRVEIRALRPDDSADLVSAIGRATTQTLYRRFFGVRRGFSKKEIDFFVNVDFVSHVALVAVLTDGGRATIVGGGRYIVVQPGKAEIAFAVIDQFQGQGIGPALLRHLVVIAQAAGLHELVADVLKDNRPMLKVFEKSGLPLSVIREPQVAHVTLQLDAHAASSLRPK